MGLSPLQATSARAELIEPTVATSKTYEFDFDSGEFTGQLIDDIYAIGQYVKKALATERFRYLVYDDQYGSEVEGYIGADVTSTALDSDIPRIVSEAIIYDERIEDVGDFIVSKTGDQVYVEFTVTLVDGTTITQEVTL